MMMKMNVFILCIVIYFIGNELISVNGMAGLTPEEDCSLNCYLLKRLKKRDNPCECGSCVKGTIAHDGICELNPAEEESSIIKNLKILSRAKKSFNERRELQDAVTVPEVTDTPKDLNDYSSQQPPRPFKQGDINGEGKQYNDSITDVNFMAIVAACSAAGLVGLVVAGVCWYKLQRNVKAASETDYPAYGVTGPAKRKDSNSGDRKLAQSAQMYHYQHQKQQMLAMEKANSEKKEGESDVDSEDEKADGDFTVYECPGLAPAGQLEVNNPLFSEEKAEKSEEKK
ncbi:DgyrCDS10480 [Dimorphilus gyrociliatus]|uniref:DgyrCDS10480 n=2 Tax=Dimorphilus gyrociliatus TaxID=2664684 RepID=A0A7I8W2B7_9ANNE|nr:DgyrCDS10480 [Dimorphilus gyrociliatus]